LPTPVLNIHCGINASLLVERQEFRKNVKFRCIAAQLAVAVCIWFRHEFYYVRRLPFEVSFSYFERFSTFFSYVHL